MEQVNVSKQSPADAMNWHDYVATFDTTHRCMYLSRRDRSDNPCRHKVLIEKLTLWPDFKPSDITQTLSDGEAALMLQVEGMAIPPHEADRQRVRIALAEQYYALAHPGKAEKRAEEKEAHDREVERLKQEHENQRHHHADDSSEDSDPGVVPVLSATEGPVGDQGKTIGKPLKWTLRLSSAEDVKRFTAAARSLQGPVGSSGAMLTMTDANMTDALPATGDGADGNVQPHAHHHHHSAPKDSGMLPNVVGSPSDAHRAAQKEDS